MKFISITPARIRLMLRVVAIVVLVGGTSLAGFIWHAQDRDDRKTLARQTNDFAPQFTEALPPDDSARYAYDVEKYYGKSGLLLDKWTRAFQSLAHGKRLAWTIGVVSVVVAAGFLFISVAYRPELARRSPRP